MLTGLQIRLILYSLAAVLTLGAMIYVRHVKNAWLDEHDRAQAAEQTAKAHQAVIGVLTQQRATQEAAAHERDQSYRWIARRLGEYRKAEQATKASDPVYAGWAATPHPGVVGVLLTEPGDPAPADDPAPAVSTPHGADRDP